MGKKGKRAAKAKGDPDAKPISAGRARRERAAALREIDAKLDALIARLETELADKDLFSPIAELEECPICFVPMPRDHGDLTFMPCCGKTICCGCIHAYNTVSRTIDVPCEFCRADPFETAQETADAMQRLADGGSVVALNALGDFYAAVAKGTLSGNVKVADPDQRALQLLLEAAERGFHSSLHTLAKMYQEGKLVNKDSVRAKKLAVAAAKLGELQAHLVLGVIYLEELEGDFPEKARSHFSFAAKNGDSLSMYTLRKMNKIGKVSQEDFDDIEDAFKEAAKVEWSEERETYAAYQRENGEYIG